MHCPESRFPSLPDSQRVCGGSMATDTLRRFGDFANWLPQPVLWAHWLSRRTASDSLVGVGRETQKSDSFHGNALRCFGNVVFGRSSFELLNLDCGFTRLFGGRKHRKKDKVDLTVALQL